MRVRLKDIATDLGVHVSTVSNILRGTRVERYTAELRDRVIAAAAAMHYQPDRTARSMRTNKSRIIGFIAENVREGGLLQNQVTIAFQVGLGHYLTDRNYHMAIMELSEVQPPQADQPLVPEVLRDRLFDGFVINQGLSPATESMMEELASEYGYPIVWWDSNRLEPTNCIYRREEEVGRMVTDRLIELGHREIGMLWDEQNWQGMLLGGGHYSSSQRRSGYLKSLAQASLAEHSIVGTAPEIVADKIRRHSLTAIITLGESDSRFAFMAASRLGLRIPEQLSIVTTDYESRSDYQGANLGGVSYNRYEVGQTAGSMLLQLIEDKIDSVPSVVVLGAYRNGDTVAPPRP